MALALADPPEITNTSASTNFNLTIREISPYTEDDKTTDRDTGRLMKNDALFVMQWTKLDNSDKHSRAKKQFT